MRLMLPIVIIWVATSALSARAAASDVRREAAMESLKRRVPSPNPVSHGGIRYEVVLTGRSRGFEQNGGIIRVVGEGGEANGWSSTTSARNDFVWTSQPQGHNQPSKVTR